MKLIAACALRSDSLDVHVTRPNSSYTKSKIKGHAYHVTWVAHYLFQRALSVIKEWLPTDVKLVI
jgi:hypothetical protein